MFVKAFDIVYDLDPENPRDNMAVNSLPTEMEFEVDEEDFDPEYDLHLYITEKTGWPCKDANYLTYY